MIQQLIRPAFFALLLLAAVAAFATYTSSASADEGEEALEIPGPLCIMQPTETGGYTFGPEGCASIQACYVLAGATGVFQNEDIACPEVAFGGEDR